MPQEDHRDIFRHWCLHGQEQKLHPYEVLQGYSRLSTPDLDRTDRREYAAYSDQRQHFCIPNVWERLLDAARILERAVKVTQVPAVADDAQIAFLHEIIPFMSQHGHANMLHAPFTFYVAGGFVVSEVLGHGGWADIDVWFQPMQKSNGNWSVACSNGPYPVNTLMVSNPEDFITAFDLDICKCAIRVECSPSGWNFLLLCTRSCACAWMNACATMTKPHPACVLPRRKGERLQKYASRSLDVDRARVRKLLAVSTPEPQVAQLELQQLMQTSVAWIFTVKNGKLASVSFGPCHLDHITSWEKSDKPDKISLTGLLYPCSHGCTNSQDIAYTPGHVHWSLRSLAGYQGRVALPGLGVVRSSFVKPQWLLDRLDQTDTEVVSDIRTRLPNAVSSQAGWSVVELYILRPSAPTRTCFLVKDWRESDVDNLYGAVQTTFIDTSGMSNLPASMFCTEQKDCVTDCEHNVAAPVLLV